MNSTCSFLIIIHSIHREAGRSLVCSVKQASCEPASLYIENILSDYLKALPTFHPFLQAS
ncbi:MAG: hypothetical protein OEQ94_05725 [Nitrosopumilus sp.]|nr:hypothetical protein [Nitrosopumilus sp.]